MSIQETPALADRNQTYAEQAAAACNIIATLMDAIATELGTTNPWSADFADGAQGLREDARRLLHGGRVPGPVLRLVPA